MQQRADRVLDAARGGHRAPTSGADDQPGVDRPGAHPGCRPRDPVVNHLSHADPFVAGLFVFDMAAHPAVLAKASLWRIPLVGPILRRIHRSPYYRHTHRGPDRARSRRGGARRGPCRGDLPRGTCTQDPGLWPMEGKTGAARLALLTGAPVDPGRELGRAGDPPPDHPQVAAALADPGQRCRPDRPSTCPHSPARHRPHPRH